MLLPTYANQAWHWSLDNLARSGYHTQRRVLASVSGLFERRNRCLEERGRPCWATRYSTTTAARRRSNAEASKVLLFLASRRVFGTRDFSLNS